MRIKLDKGAFPPQRVYPTDAGLDICAMYDGVVRAGDSAVFRTGVHVELPAYTAGVLMSRSGLMMLGITSTGLIDEQYQGEIMVKLFNHSSKTYWVSAGDRISQLIVVPVRYEAVEIVDDFGPETERGSNGFGSTGK